MSVINTNITSMIGQSNLSKSQNALQTSMERLSSGLRINSAKDDAAGQAIANRMTAQITGLAQAQRNANDGISLAQTAEGALNQINDNVQRIRELSVQAANGTNSQDDLQSIQEEINQRLDEVDRISEETNFNGVNVLDTNEGLRIQVGANDNETITVGLQTINRETLGLDGFNVTGARAANANDVFNAVTADPANDDTIVVDTTTYTYSSGESAWQTQVSGSAVNVTLSAIEDAIAENDGEFSANDDYFVAEDADGNLVVTDADTSGNPVFRGFDEDGEVTLGAETAFNQIATAGPMDTLDTALNNIDTLRSELGAVQNRFEDAITNLNTNETNLAAARSRIEDADYAVEVANMTRAQILQQAGTSVLAQANQIPQNVLSLLG